MTGVTWMTSHPFTGEIGNILGRNIQYLIQSFTLNSFGYLQLLPLFLIYHPGFKSQTIKVDPLFVCQKWFPNKEDPIQPTHLTSDPGSNFRKASIYFCIRDSNKPGWTLAIFSKSTKSKLMLKNRQHRRKYRFKKKRRYWCKPSYLLAERCTDTH